MKLRRALAWAVACAAATAQTLREDIPLTLLDPATSPERGAVCPTAASSVTVGGRLGEMLYSDSLYL